VLITFLSSAEDLKWIRHLVKLGRQCAIGISLTKLRSERYSPDLVRSSFRPFHSAGLIGLAFCSPCPSESPSPLLRPIMPINLVDCVAITLSILCVLVLRRNHKRTRFPLPPGPPRWPVVGSLFSMPKDSDRLDVFNQWGKQYGTIHRLSFPDL
jgi:hypothetical protein